MEVISHLNMIYMANEENCMEIDCHSCEIQLSFILMWFLIREVIPMQLLDISHKSEGK